MKKANANNAICSVTSDASPQHDQKHRASGNFSTQEAPDGTHQIQWFVTENDNFSQIEFDVMEDHHSALHRKDPVVFSGVKNETITKYKGSRELYIANPSHAGGKTFIVQVWPYPS